ncbi:uncharacterized protein B0P05DRAFT_562657, partial [Gilbertella persicaria]|uniref:uncharacterized protein n=1 Tax=Gilbertella persicaria TaxID=101096 RepID=UPI00221EA7AF
MNKKDGFALKRIFIYIVFGLIILFTWFQLDSVKKSPDQKHTHSFNLEVDPPTWHIQTLENEPALTQKSLFPLSAFSKQNQQRLPPITAIINRVEKRQQGIVHAVQHLAKYPFVKEILIYNSFKSPLDVKSFYNGTDIQIQVIQTDASLFNVGKFTACAVASFDMCYFQDDLWLNTYLDSLYTHSLRYPDQFVVNSRPSNYIDYMTWRFQNQAISLHTGYADMRYGAFVSRQKVQAFLSQMSVHGLEGESKFRFIEIYFSIWLNQYPYLISNPLLSFGRDSFKHLDSVNNRKFVQYHMYHALSILESNLNNNSLLGEQDHYFTKTEATPPVEERDVRSSCANDRCLFITNIHAMPIEQPLFNSSFISNMSDYEQVYQHTWPNLPKPTNYIYQSYYKAVDQDTETCWNTLKSKSICVFISVFTLCRSN